MMDNFVVESEDAILIEEAINTCIIKIRNILGTVKINSMGRTAEEQLVFDIDAVNKGNMWVEVFLDITQNYSETKAEHYLTSKKFYNDISLIVYTHFNSIT